MNWRSGVALAAGFLALAWIAGAVGLGNMARDIALAGWVLPFTGALYLAQLFLAGQAWRACLGVRIVSPGAAFRLRWIREGINALLPVAQIGGQVVGAQLLARRGVRPALAAAGTILDLTLEAASQILFTLAGMAVLLVSRPDRAWLAWMGGSLALTASCVIAFVMLQRAGGLRLVEAAMARLAARWPGAAVWSLGGLHRILMVRQSDHRALLRATVLHGISWALGSLEVWLVLAALGHPVPMLASFVVESLGMAARSAGFAVPGAFGVQEGGLVLVCRLFGVPAEAALALSVLKRVREAVIGLPALVAWQRMLAATPQHALGE